MTALAVAGDVLREALARRWVLALLAGVTALLATVLLAVRLDVVDGVLAATRLFGGSSPYQTMRAVDVALRPAYAAAAHVVFWGGLAAGALASADFAPRLLAPGRIEHLLALPVRRAELLAGTFAGVLALSLAGGAYGAGGLTLILWAKTGVWSGGPLLAAALAAVAFAAVYAAMLLAAVLLRSAAASALAGAAVVVLGVVASHRAPIAAALEPGAGRAAFLGLSAALPRLEVLAGAAADVALARPVEWARVATSGAATLVFAGALLALSLSRFEGKDY